MSKRSVVVAAAVSLCLVFSSSVESLAHVSASQIIGGSSGISAMSTDASAWPPATQVPPQAKLDPDWAYAPPSPPSVPLPPNTVALTYDDGPDAETLDIATYLHEHGISATFFVNGCHFGSRLGGPVCATSGDINQSPTILGELVQLGQRVANHTTDHCELTGTIGGDGPCATPLTSAQVVAEVATTQAILDPFVLDGMYFFRPPANGWSRQIASEIDANPSLQKLIGPFAYDSTASDWSCLAPDANPPLTPSGCATQAEDHLSPSSHAGIIQLHDRNPNDPGGTYTLRLTKCLVGGHTGDCPGDGVLDADKIVPLDAIPGVRGTLSFSSPAVVSTDFADATSHGWELDPTRYDSIRMGNVDGDSASRSDVCGRTVDGVYCAIARSDGTFAPATHWQANLTDANGYQQPQYGSTMMLGDIDGDGRADLCMRGASGLFCFRSTGSSFSTSLTWGAGDFSDANGWDSSEARWGSLRLVDINGDGKSDVCGRSSSGIHCQLFGGSGFLPGRDVLTTEFTDARGWDQPQYGATIQFGDIDGNGSADVCGRGRYGLVCALAIGGGFGAPSVWSDIGACAWSDGCGPFSDHTGWGDRTRWRSVQLADVNGDHLADVCGRAATGVVCGLSNGSSFDRFHYVANTDFLDGYGWSQSRYGDTVQLADANGDGKADACGRGVYGLMCALAP